MPWVKLTDDFAEHPKIQAVGPIAVALHVAALCYCNRNLTDGFIPWSKAHTLVNMEYHGVRDGTVVRQQVTTVDTECIRDEEFLCSVVPDKVLLSEAIIGLIHFGMWTEVTGGYLIHDYLQYQPSKQSVIDERNASKGRMQRTRTNRRASDVADGVAPNVAPQPQEKFGRSSDDVAGMLQECSGAPVPVSVTKDSSVSSKSRKRYEYTELFETFWSEYPNKNGKAEAFGQFNRLHPTDELTATIIASVRSHKDSKQWQGGYVMEASRFLRNKRWEDEGIDKSLFGNNGHDPDAVDLAAYKDVTDVAELYR